MLACVQCKQLYNHFWKGNAIFTHFFHMHFAYPEWTLAKSCTHNSFRLHYTFINKHFTGGVCRWRENFKSEYNNNACASKCEWNKVQANQQTSELASAWAHVCVCVFVFISFNEITIFGWAKACTRLQFKLFIFTITVGASACGDLQWMHAMATTNNKNSENEELVERKHSCIWRPQN